MISLASVLLAGVWSQLSFGDDLLSLWLSPPQGTCKFPSLSKAPVFSPFFFFFGLFLVLVGALKPPLGGCDEPLLEPEPDPLPEPLFAEPEPPPDPLFFEPDPLPDPLPDLLLLPDPLPLALAAAISKAP